MTHYRRSSRARRASDRLHPRLRCARSLASALPIALLVTLGAACSPNEGTAAQASESQPADPDDPQDHAGHEHGEPGVEPVPAAAAAEIADLIEKLKPLDPTLTSDHHDRWFIRNQKLVADLTKTRALPDH